MVNKCSAFGCKSGYGKREEDITFHRFPISDPELLKTWNSKVGRKDFKPSTHSRVCSKHFNASCFQSESEDSNQWRKRENATLTSR